MATNTILIDCNQQQSVEAQSGNATSNAIWTNKVSEGLMLNPGDRVSVSSAFINEVGSGEDTIQFTEANNSATPTLQFYKCADAENCLILPRKWSWFHIKGASSDAASSSTDEFGSLPGSFLAFHDVTPYKELYRRKHDGKRYTIMEQRFINDGGDYDGTHGRPYYVDYSETVQLTLPTGYHSATNICELLTEQLHKSTTPQEVSTYSLSLSAPTFHPFQCANPTNYSHTKYTSADKWVPYKFVGILDPELYTAGYNLGYNDIRSSTTTSVTTDFHYTTTNLQLFQQLFDAQAQRSDLIFGTSVSTENTRFVHIDHNVYVETPGNPVRFGSDDDITKSTARLFVQYSPNHGWATNDNGYIQLQWVRFR